MDAPLLTILHAPAVRTSFDPFPSATDLEAHLRRTVRGEVRFD